MAKRKRFSPIPVVASVLTLPTIACAHNNGPLTREQVCAEVIQLQRASYYDRTSVDTQYPMNFQAALARAAAQQQAFASYGGVNSSSAAGLQAAVASDKPTHLDS